tara:strand:+ start:1409 stop:2821 length:1413 start_codon:yes stop_codon:yes gene_type:complete
MANPQDNIHPFTDTDKLYVLPCIQEKQAFGKMDKENVPGRPSVCFQDAVDVSKKMNPSLEKTCKDDTMNDNDLCTYNKALYYVGKKRTSCDPEIVWNHIVDFVNRSNLNSAYETATKNFFIVSHHNTLKGNILKTVMKKLFPTKDMKHHIANCSCFLIEYTDNGWIFKIVFDGFPDKEKYNYFIKKGDGKLLGPTLIDSEPGKKDGWGQLVTWLNYIEDKKTRIFLIRHGNAFHNKPLKLTGSAINRTIDTNLTPLGIYQARVLGETLIEDQYLKPQTTDNVNIFCSSFMNRAQHTALELVYALNLHTLEATANPQSEEKTITRRPSVKQIYQNAPLTYYHKLATLERFFTDFACSRLIRKSGGLVKFLQNIHKLAKWDMNFKLGENGTVEKLIPDGRRASVQATESHMMSALQNIAKYSMEEWDKGSFCKSYAVADRTPIVVSGGKKKTKRHRKKKRKKKTKKKKLNKK